MIFKDNARRSFMGIRWNSNGAVQETELLKEWLTTPELMTSFIVKSPSLGVTLLYFSFRGMSLQNSRLMQYPDIDDQFKKNTDKAFGLALAFQRLKIKPSNPELIYHSDSCKLLGQVKLNGTDLVVSRNMEVVTDQKTEIIAIEALAVMPKQH